MKHASLAVAARNNAEWCDVVARAHGASFSFEPALWINHGMAPPLYPNAVTLQGREAAPSQIAALRDLIAAAPDRSLAVKDSFDSLELAPLGFAPLFDAEWIWRDAGLPPAAHDDGWTQVRDAAMLAEWARDWGADEETPGADIFTPALLDESAHAMLGCRQDGRFIAGCVASRSGQAVGISNLFVPADDGGALRAGAVVAAMAFAPDLPVVGYESGEALAGLISLDFRPIGRLRVWFRAGERDPGFISG